MLSYGPNKEVGSLIVLHEVQHDADHFSQVNVQLILVLM